MNAVEIAEAVETLAQRPFDAAEFPFAFLAAFGNKETTLRKLRSGASNGSDLPGAILQRNNIHIATCAPRATGETLTSLRDSPRTAQAKAKFVLATDGEIIEAEDLANGATVACAFPELADHFGLFLALAGISTVKQIRESSFDIRATGRLNKLYVELLKQNPAWGEAERRHDMNHFLARLIFCFFAEDTGIFSPEGAFTRIIEQMTEADGSNTHAVIATLFRAMNAKAAERAGTPAWADSFPYVNGGLFSGNDEAPRFSRIARTYLLHIGKLDWTKINPDIFGSMIQAVAEDDERGALGMHYTSVPNILKVLNPLFLSELREQLAAAGDNARALLNLRKRLTRIRVFDPACGSGNFLVIAYKEMREIEAEIDRRRGEAHRISGIPLSNFRGIELRDFPAEIARLALIVAKYQCDVLHRGQREALDDVLPLDSHNWITCGNALRLDWLSICPPTGTGVKAHADDLFATPLKQAQIDFENEGGETYICGNPPYKGSQTQSLDQKADLAAIFAPYDVSSKQVDYVGGWFVKAAEYSRLTSTRSAFVSTNSICQGRIVPIIWPLMSKLGQAISFAYTSFKWANLASHNAGVTVVVVGLEHAPGQQRRLFETDSDGSQSVRVVSHISPYLVSAETDVVEARSRALSDVAQMDFGNMPADGGNLLLTRSEVDELEIPHNLRDRIIKRALGSAELIRGIERYCLWVTDDDLPEAIRYEAIRHRTDDTRDMRLSSKDSGTRGLAAKPHQFREQKIGKRYTIAVPSVSSENRDYFPVDLLASRSTVTNLAFGLYDAPLWNLAIVASRIHLAWIATVCGKLKTDFRYSNTLGWNTFPVPPLTENNKADLTRCAEGILLAREAHYPATIAVLYEPDAMPADLRAAHERNDEMLERIYIGRRFRNDTERLEKLFELYTKMTAGKSVGTRTAPRKEKADA